jgi:hypothetical protein
MGGAFCAYIGPVNLNVIAVRNHTTEWLVGTVFRRLMTLVLSFTGSGGFRMKSLTEKRPGPLRIAMKGG